MKRLIVAVLAAVTGCWAYIKLRSHPKTASQVAELERQGRLVVDKASAVASSAKDQAATRASEVADSAAKALSPIQEKLSGLRGENASNTSSEPPIGQPGS